MWYHFLIFFNSVADSERVFHVKEGRFCGLKKAIEFE